MELFNAEEYFRNIATTNKLCVDEGFRFCTCSGLENLEDAIDQFRKVSNFFIFDDLRFLVLGCKYTFLL